MIQDSTQAPKLVVNCLPLTEKERAGFVEAAGSLEQVFVGDVAQRYSMSWRPHLPEEYLERATAIIGNAPAAEVANCPNLEWMQTNSAGVGAYMAPGVLPEGCCLTNASGAYGQSVSEHMFATTLALMKNIHLYRDRQAEGVWHDEGAAATLDGAVALVVGTGDIGSHYARLVSAMGAHTVGVRRNPAAQAEGIDEMHGFDELDELLAQADVVALSVPSTPATHHLINAGRLSAMKPSVIVVNAGRGDAIDPDALLEALRAGSIRAAGLDVTEPEPLPEGHPLWSEPRCLITPHVAGGNHLATTPEKIFGIALRNLATYATGTLPAKPLGERYTAAGNGRN